LLRGRRRKKYFGAQVVFSKIGVIVIAVSSPSTPISERHSMNKYVLMMAAAGLIAAAPAYYAFQAQAEEAPATQTEEAAPSPGYDGTKAPATEGTAAAPAATEEAAPAADEHAGEKAPAEEGHEAH
jgi:hypothetical protein